jgi:hypothetical protein
MSLAVILVAALVAAMTAWGACFLWLSNAPGAPLRAAMAVVFVIGTLASFVLLKRRWRTVAGFLIAFAVLLAWYFSIRPSNDRQWAPEVAVLPTATVNGNLVEIRNIRNFDYRTGTDFTPRYYDKTFDLDKLQSADFISVHWGSPAIAHVMASFGFGGDDFVAFSIEMRKEKGEAGSMLRSCFRKYELIYVVADERDVIRVRTNYRPAPGCRSRISASCSSATSPRSTSFPARPSGTTRWRTTAPPACSSAPTPIRAGPVTTGKCS